MTTIKQLGSFALIASCLAVAPNAFAQILDVGAGVNGGIDVGQVRPTSSANANINVSVTATSSGASTSAGASATTGAAVVATSTATGSEEAVVATDAGALVITRGDVREGEYEEMDASEVRTSSDLDAYARGFVQGDENVSRVSAGPESVSLWYKDKAKLLGFIPVTVSAEARVAADGTVEVSYPWYRFLTTYNGDDLEGTLDASAGGIARSEGAEELSPSAQARILAAMRAAMSAHYESNLEADAGASGELEIE